MYYQVIAIREVLKKMGSGQNRALLTFATRWGKKFKEVNLLKNISDAEHLHKALFVCNRNELKWYAVNAVVMSR